MSSKFCSVDYSSKVDECSKQVHGIEKKDYSEGAGPALPAARRHRLRVPHFSPPLREVGSPPFQKRRQPRPSWAYPIGMDVNWVELAQKMAEAARAQVAADRKRLQEILAERQQKPGARFSRPLREVGS